MPKPAKKPAAKSAAKPVKKPVKKPANSPTKKPVKKATKVAKRSTAKRSRALSVKAPAAKGNSIIETSAVTWSHSSTGPSFEQVQLAAYHRWLQGGASDLDNWFSAEGDLRGKKH